jgi:hypothetical protein
MILFSMKLNIKFLLEKERILIINTYLNRERLLVVCELKERIDDAEILFNIFLPSLNNALQVFNSSNNCSSSGSVNSGL